ncbi:MAG: P-II family nitrogen regulator [Lachnospiraceae bacterium]|nr:P-II family nitrogen regulator [Lachnospiraceae bacterium]
MADNKFEMIFCIVNAGFSGEVMDAAREMGATGGTIIHARGTANKNAEETFKITISPEKDLVMLAVHKDIKDKVMKAIYDKVGLGTNGNGVAFSLPISDEVGIK